MKKSFFVVTLLGILFNDIQSPVSAELYNNFISSNSCCEEETSCNGNFKAGAEWIYWKAQQDKLLGGIFSDSTDPLSITSRAIRPNFKYESGFRVGIGYELPDNLWEAGVCYTYLPSHAKAFATTTDNQTIFNNNDIDNLLANGFLEVSSFNAKWNLTLHQIDVDISRKINFDCNFTLRPHIGFRSIWMDQNLQLNYITSDVYGDLGNLPIRENFREKFTSYGVEGGLWAEWQMGCGLSLVGHFGGSLLYSKFKLCETFNSTAVSEENVNAEGQDIFWTGIPTLDYFVGVQYSYDLCETKIAARVGWEQHLLFDTHRFYFQTGQGDLSLQGLTIGLGVAF